MLPQDQKGISLNDALEKGPNLLPVLWGTLLRFRVGRIGVVGDLEKAFLQILLHENDRNVCCFLWQHPDGCTVTYRLTRVFFGASSSPFLLQVVLKHHLESEEEDLEVTRELLRNLYVDDTVNSFDTDNDAEYFWTKAVDIFRKGGFNLRKFQSNSTNLQIERDCIETTHKVLGITWLLETDEFLVIDTFKPVLNHLTKREVASLMAGIYDPLGLVVPIVTPIKCFLQDLWKLKLPWDSTLDRELQKQLENILFGMQGCETITAPRWLGIVKQASSEQNCSVHVFTDASCRAYAAVAYIRVVYQSKVTVTLITGKCRLAPPTGLTIPRLELMGILLGSRLLESLKSEFRDVVQISSYYLWTDSVVALSWVEKGPSVGGVFVANRVHEIRSSEAEIRWVSGTQNPADLPSRGMTASELKNSQLWWHGPQWMYLDEEHWPSRSITNRSSTAEDNNVATVSVMLHEPTVQWLEELVDPTRTSKWSRTVRSLCWMLRWKHPNHMVCIQPSEISRATHLIYTQVQKKFFSKELSALERSESVPHQSVINSLHPFLHNGLLRMGGRLQQCVGTHEEKHPVLLKRCGVVNQFVQDTHEQMQHAGVSFVISEMRRRGVWILRPKKSVSSVIRSCRRCRRFIAAPAAETTAPLPDCRVNVTRAFDTTGMDLGGPLLLKDGLKVWFVVFTCMSVRAIHLELASSMSAESLMCAFQRFASRRGMPRKCIGDHGANFVALSRYMKERRLEVSYEFIVERGPWWGGVWERMVQTVKGLLRRTIGKALLTWEQLETVLVETEKVINRRPISFQWEGAQAGSVPLPLYPEQFLLSPRDTVEEQRDFNVSEDLRLRKMYFTQLSEIWEREYLYQVLGSKGEVWQSTPNPLQTGEVVLVADGEKRLGWKLGVVQELHTGRDGRCRSATVRVGRSTLNRPIQKLYKLELMMHDVNNLPPLNGAVTDSSEVLVTDSVKQNDTCTSLVEDCCNNEDTIQLTRCGRVVRKPHRFDDE